LGWTAKIVESPGKRKTKNARRFKPGVSAGSADILSARRAVARR
jgi:hypothetical protein